MSYLDEIPTEEHVKESLTTLFNTWQGRNTFIAEVRRMLEGENPIQAPANTQYKVQTMRTYMLTGIVNEKVSRFSHIPTIQVIPNYFDSFDEARSNSTELEQAFRSAFYEMERNGDGDVWSKVTLDSVVLDEGVERIERATSAFWPELSTMQEPDAIKKYKLEHGFPMRTVYVPLENFYPVYEGPTLVESYEIDTGRTLRSIKNNPMFSEGWSKLEGYSTGKVDELETKVPVVLYCNQQYFCYFALSPALNSRLGDSLSLYNTREEPKSDQLSVTSPIYLGGYRHGLGKSIYNCVPGRFGGWKGSKNRIEGVSRGLLELNQKADEITSQVLTNVRARYWPTLVHKIDYERRGIASGSLPKPLDIKEGQNIAIFKDEEISPIFKVEHDEAVVWLYDEIKSQISRLGGSASLFGSRDPGVDTGYHQALQVTQAEHLDEKIEQNLVQGAIRRATIICDHIIAMNSNGNNIGEVYTTYIEKGKRGKVRRYASFNPDLLSPMPMFDARVRKPRPVDFVAALRAAITATDERGGKGALFSDDTARAEILGREDPDVEERRILVEQQKRALATSGALTGRILQMMNLALVQEGTEEGSPGAVDPVLQGIASGGLREGQGGGMPPGQSQPEATLGFEDSTVSAAMGVV